MQIRRAFWVFLGVLAFAITDDESTSERNLSISAFDRDTIASVWRDP